MNSLTPFIHHTLETRPGISAPPEQNSSRVSPPLGTDPLETPVTPPSQPDCPGVQLPPSEVPGSHNGVPHPDPHTTPAAIPMTDGTPAACFQTNADAFLYGDVSGSVMAQYGEQLFGTLQHTHSAHPAPEEEEEDSGVEALVEWREDAPYG